MTHSNPYLEKRPLRALKQRLFKSRAKTQLSGKNYRIGKRLLLDIVDILNAAEIDYMVDSGTLIGLARDRDILPWDDDIDIVLPDRELSKFLKVLWKFRLRGWWISHRKIWYDHEAWKSGDYQSIKLRNRRFLVLRGRVKADINVKYRVGDRYVWHMLGMGMICESPARYFDGYELLEYEGRQVKVPAGYDAYLTDKYGDWRTPNRDYDGKKDDGTVVATVKDGQVSDGRQI